MQQVLNMTIQREGPRGSPRLRFIYTIRTDMGANAMGEKDDKDEGSGAE